MTPQHLIKMVTESPNGFPLVLPRKSIPGGARVRIGGKFGGPYGRIVNIRTKEDRNYSARINPPFTCHVIAWFESDAVANWLLKEAPLNETEREKLETFLVSAVE